MRSYHINEIHPAPQLCAIGAQNLIVWLQSRALRHTAFENIANDRQDFRLVKMQSQFIEKFAIQILCLQTAHIKKVRQRRAAGILRFNFYFTPIRALT